MNHTIYFRFLLNVQQENNIDSMTKFYCLIIDSRGYHVYTETSWSHVKLGHKVRAEIEANTKSIASDPYSCVIKPNTVISLNGKASAISLVKSHNGFIFSSNKKVVAFMEH